MIQVVIFIIFRWENRDDFNILGSRNYYLQKWKKNYPTFYYYFYGNLYNNFKIVYFLSSKIIKEAIHFFSLYDGTVNGKTNEGVGEATASPEIILAFLKIFAKLNQKSAKKMELRKHNKYPFFEC